MNNRILLIIGSLKTGGAERVTINTGAELQRRGFDVYYALQRNVIELPNNIAKDKIFILRKSNSQSKLYKVYALFVGIFLVGLKVKPKIVIGFSRLSSFLACFTLCRRVIARFDANPYRLSKKQHRYANCIFAWPFVKKIVVPSNGMYKAISALKPNKKDKLIIIPNTIDVTNVIALSQQRTDFQFDFKFICAMGRLSYDKNFELLINAYHNSNIRKHYKLVIIGDGKLRNRLETLVSDLGIKPDVFFPGFMSNPYPIVKQAQLLVNSSRNESFCNVILEGLALSLPVIATDCDYGPADMIKNNVNGFLVKTDNVPALINILDRIAEDDKVLTKFKENARTSIAEFELGQVIEKWISLLV